MEPTADAPPVPPYVYTSVERNSRVDEDSPVKNHLPFFEEANHYDTPDESMIDDLTHPLHQSEDESEMTAVGSLKSPQHLPLPGVEDEEDYYANPEAIEETPVTQKRSSVGETPITSEYSCIQETPITSEYSCIQETPNTREYSYIEVTEKESSQKSSKAVHTSETPAAEGQGSSNTTDPCLYASVDKHKEQED